MTSQVEEESDRLSQLPGHVEELILSRLSISEAVRNSVLFSSWRYKWTALLELVFDDDCMPSSFDDESSAPSLDDESSGLANAINHVLLFHTGPICKFSQGLSPLFFTCSGGPSMDFLSVKCWYAFKALGILPNLRLQGLNVEIDFGSVEEISTALYLMTRFPNLEEVRFSAQVGGPETVDTMSNFWECNRLPMSQLKFAPFTGIQGTMLEMGFMKFLLLQSHMLPRMEIRVVGDGGGPSWRHTSWHLSEPHL
ncbi:F-box/FBD/LRR-repeat protein At3g14710-like [Punica granatum]|uniref:F-box/FBD/LRR-repeat protein At3g14710-like n=1 Tax=Punica granatum TaxID=22663 RepID=A0A6P8BW32_PUNGR|nr:F-box/FBD/LRR-repeat protein At3g14710-like [Punica granatum]